MLAERLADYRGREDVTVLALPRGGVPVGYEVARAIGTPLDVFVVRKLGLPGREELAMGAIASGGVRVLNEEVLAQVPVAREVIDRVAEAERRELDRRERLYRGDRPAPDVFGRTVVLVDDGLATGATMRAATTALRRLGAARVVVAVPVSSVAACEEFRSEADACVCVATPEPFYGVGAWYDDFSQTPDAEVRALLARAAREREPTARAT